MGLATFRESVSAIFPLISHHVATGHGRDGPRLLVVRLLRRVHGVELYVSLDELLRTRLWLAVHGSSMYPLGGVSTNVDGPRIVKANGPEVSAHQNHTTFTRRIVEANGLEVPLQIADTTFALGRRRVSPRVPLKSTHTILKQNNAIRNNTTRRLHA